MKSQQIKTRFVFDRRGKATNFKSANVLIEVYCDRQRKWYKTPINIYKNQWSDIHKVINSPNSLEYNAILDELITKFNKNIMKIIEGDNTFTFQRFDRLINGETPKNTSFIDLIEKRTEERTDIEPATRKKERTFIRVLKEFKKIEFLSDLTRENILCFDRFLHEKDLKQTTIHAYHKRFKAHIKFCMLSDLIKNNPYDGVKIEQGKSDKVRYLTFAELQKLAQVDISDIALQRAKDLFLFQCFTGLSYSDIYKIDYKKDIEERNGNYIINQQRQKTNQFFYIVLLSPAIKILEKYNYNLPRQSNQKYNYYLKIVAKHASISKILTSHMGRHTFAVTALNNGVKIEVLSKMLGHSKIETTQVYAKIVNSTIEDSFNFLEKTFCKKIAF